MKTHVLKIFIQNCSDGLDIELQEEDTDDVDEKKCTFISLSGCVISFDQNLN